MTSACLHCQVRQKVLRVQVSLQGETVGSTHSELVTSGVCLATGTRRRTKGPNLVGTSQRDSLRTVWRFCSAIVCSMV